MSRKHFEQIAAQFAKTKPFVPQGEDAKALTSQELVRRNDWLAQWKNDVVCIADVLAGFNVKFDRVRFYRACGVEVK